MKSQKRDTRTARPKPHQLARDSVRRVVRLLDDCEAILRAVHHNPVATTDMIIAAMERANRCRAMSRELQQTSVLDHSARVGTSA